MTEFWIALLDGNFGSRPLSEVFDYQPGWELCSEADQAEVERLMGLASPM